MVKVIQSGQRNLDLVNGRRPVRQVQRGRVFTSLQTLRASSDPIRMKVLFGAAAFQNAPQTLHGMFGE